MKVVRVILRSLVVGVRMAMVEMRSHPMRSLLSMLGVMLGVASLVAMLTLIGGMDVFFRDRIGAWAGSVFFTPRNPPRGAGNASWGRSPGMRLSDGDYLVEYAPDVDRFHRVIERQGEVSIGGLSRPVKLRGLDRRSLEQESVDLVVSAGRSFTDEEMRHGAPVCLITWEIAQGLGYRGSATSLPGKTCRFRNRSFTIVGVLHPRDPDIRPWTMRGAVVIPLTTMQTLVSGKDPNPGTLQIAVSDPRQVHAQAVRTAAVLAARHRGVEDFEYRTTEWVEEVTKMLGNAGILMSLVATVSLVVGGLSIMNVMLSSISERIHEIGIRKALGAGGIQIFSQFLAEAVTLCCIGGAVGSILGTLPVIFGTAVKKSAQGAIVPTILPLHAAAVLMTVVCVGILFGLYPAIKALRMDPVDALRCE